MRSSLRNVGSRPRSGGSTGFARSGMRESPRASGARPPTIATAFFSAAAARAHERGEPFAEPRRRERCDERLPHLGDLATAERALAIEERVPLCVQALADECKLALARLELRLEPAELPFALVLGRSGGRCPACHGNEGAGARL